jgi:hypothetical protein
VAAAKDTPRIKKSGDGIDRIKGDNGFIVKPAFKDLAFSNITISGETASELSISNKERNISDENGMGPFVQPIIFRRKSMKMEVV